MNIIQAIILGIVEGLTEFLPISSTGHIILVEKLLGIEKTNSFFTVVIQFGAILAAVWFFRSRIKEIAFVSFGAIKAKKQYSKMNHEEKYGIWILVSIIPTLVVGFLLRKKIDEWQNSTIIIIVSTIVFGIIFYAIEKYQANHKTIDTKDLTLKNLLIMGLAQAIAVIPGVSRSGSTIAGGLTQKISIKDAVELSFIMGIPVILIASLYKIVTGLDGLSFDIVIMTIIGTLTSFCVGLWSIRLTLGVLVKHGFFPFMLYRLGLGIVLSCFVYLGIFR
ncbi:MAG: undecaprenyl-diphosphatase UppP [candidate division SR1 bacterium]|nr:undecaprenyl-diphosphatase UppP [candidate division SR1 bacterium]